MAKPKEFHLLTMFGGVTSPISCSPAQWLAGIWRREKEKLEKNPEHKPAMPAIIYTQRITEQEFAMLMEHFPLAKPNINLDGAGGRN